MINTIETTRKKTEHSVAVLDPNTLKPLYEFTDPFYGRLYNGHIKARSDSPDQNRIGLIRQARKYIKPLTPADIVLDVGSGAQIFERQYFQANQAAHQRPKATFVTLDRARIQPENLLMRQSKRVLHVQASGDGIPLPDDSVALVVSNMALDFMPTAAISEVRRVMKMGAHALIRLHHPSLYSDNAEELLKSFLIPENEKVPIRFWEELRARGALTRNQTEIYRKFISNGFDVKDIRLAKDQKDSWWELDIVKSPFEKISSKRIGKLVSKVIAMRKTEPKGPELLKKTRNLARQIQEIGDKITDPKSPHKKINFTTLIARIDAGII